MKKILFIQLQEGGPINHWHMPYIREYLSPYTVVYCNYSNYLSFLESHKPDLIFLSWKGQDAALPDSPRKTPSQILAPLFLYTKKHSIPVASWNYLLFDRLKSVNFKETFDLNLKKDIDFIFDYSPYSLNLLGAISQGHHYMPLGSHEFWAQPLPIPRDIPIGFLGERRVLRNANQRCYRTRTINRLYRSGVPIQIAGKWEKVGGDNIMPDITNHGRLGWYQANDPSTLNQFYNRCVINLDLPWQDVNIDHHCAGRNKEYEYIFKDPLVPCYRTYESMSTGNIYLTIKQPMYEDMGLQDGMNCFFYEGCASDTSSLAKEIIKTIKSINSLPENELKAIRANALEWSNANTYRHRWTKMFNIITS